MLEAFIPHCSTARLRFSLLATQDRPCGQHSGYMESLCSPRAAVGYNLTGYEGAGASAAYLRSQSTIDLSSWTTEPKTVSYSAEIVLSDKDSWPSLCPPLATRRPQSLSDAGLMLPTAPKENGAPKIRNSAAIFWLLQLDNAQSTLIVLC